MTVLSSLKFVEYKTQIANNAVANRRKKVIAKMEERILLAIDANYTPTKIRWTRGEAGIERKLLGIVCRAISGHLIEKRRASPAPGPDRDRDTNPAFR